MASPTPVEKQAASEPVSGPSRRVRCEELMGEGRELRILHRGGEYRLRIAKNDKLILTK